VTIDGRIVGDEDLGREVEYRATHDPTRTPERGLLAGWNETMCFVRFWSFVLDGYRPQAWACRPESLNGAASAAAAEVGA
jgi:hypothetical protein